MTRYMCLESGQVFETEDEAEAHAENKHRQDLQGALSRGLFYELSDDEDAEEVYQREVQDKPWN